MGSSALPDAVLIDLYDTLVWGEWPGLRDSMAARIGITSAALQSAFESTRPSRGVGSLAGAGEDLASVLTACGLDPEPGLLAELLELERRSLLTRIHLYEDSIPVLRTLRARGVRTALVSNCSRSTRPVVDDLGLEREMDAVVLSFEVGAAKPDAAIYRAALDRLGAKPAGAAFVDDQSVYCDGAAALGMRTYLIQRDASHDDGVSTDGHTLIPDLAALLA
jgi:HAD superfamily hydrolase (TIGR01509 family)